MQSKSDKVLIRALAVLFVLSASVVAQTRKAVDTFPLGDQVIAIPAPPGFEESTSQFENIKKHFTETEAPDNDLLVVHLPHADCEKLRAGEFGPFNFNTKVSIRRAIRDQNYSAERFASLVSTFRKSGSQIMNINGPTMKGVLERLDKTLSALREEETQVDLSQPVNLGEFDTRPNVYGVMLLLNLTTRTGDREVTVPILGGLSYLRVKQRLIYVYTYRKYTSKTDVGILRDFTKQWIGQILTAN